MAENKREEQLKEITDRLEQGVQDLFTSERYTEYLQTMEKFHTVNTAMVWIFLVVHKRLLNIKKSWKDEIELLIWN